MEKHDFYQLGKSNVTDHLKENSDHTADFNNSLILAQKIIGKNYDLEKDYFKQTADSDTVWTYQVSHIQKLQPQFEQK